MSKRKLETIDRKIDICCVLLEYSYETNNEILFEVLVRFIKKKYYLRRDSITIKDVFIPKNTNLDKLIKKMNCSVGRYLDSKKCGCMPYCETYDKYPITKIFF